MKKLRSILCIVLALTMIIGGTAVSSYAQDAEENEAKEFKALCYNVAGLPDFNKLLGKGGKDVKNNQKLIGELINKSDYDIVAVQEDFGYHSSLVKPMTNYPYKTNHTGGIPGGDGLNLYSKFPLYNETRIKWNKAYGIIDHGADDMTPKGILYSVIEIADGVYVDFYDIHADANGDEGSREARRDNLKQLADLITARGTDRPVIVTGDVNISSHFSDDCGINEYLFYGCGLKDAWIELHNNGDYEDFSNYYDPTKDWSDCWGRWDSVEHFMYRSGGGIDLEATDFEYIFNYDSEGKDLSDHASASVTFSYTVTDDFKENTEELTVVKADIFGLIKNKIYYIFRDIYLIIKNFDELKGFIGWK